MINQKWVTDVSEFKYGVGEDNKKGKLYLSAILDLCDRRPVSFVYNTRNDNPLVFDTFDKAVEANFSCWNDTKYVSRGKMYR